MRVEFDDLALFRVSFGDHQLVVGWDKIVVGKRLAGQTTLDQRDDSGASVSQAIVNLPGAFKVQVVTGRATNQRYAIKTAIKCHGNQLFGIRQPIDHVQGKDRIVSVQGLQKIDAGFTGKSSNAFHAENGYIRQGTDAYREPLDRQQKRHHARLLQAIGCDFTAC